MAVSLRGQLTNSETSLLITVWCRGYKHGFWSQMHLSLSHATQVPLNRSLSAQGRVSLIPGPGNVELREPE